MRESKRAPIGRKKKKNKKITPATMTFDTFDFTDFRSSVSGSQLVEYSQLPHSLRMPSSGAPFPAPEIMARAQHKSNRNMTKLAEEREADLIHSFKKEKQTLTEAHRVEVADLKFRLDHIRKDLKIAFGMEKDRLVKSAKETQRQAALKLRFDLTQQLEEDHEKAIGAQLDEQRYKQQKQLAAQKVELDFQCGEMKASLAAVHASECNAIRVEMAVAVEVCQVQTTASLLAQHVVELAEVEARHRQEVLVELTVQEAALATQYRLQLDDAVQRAVMDTAASQLQDAEEVRKEAVQMTSQQVAERLAKGHAEHAAELRARFRAELEQREKAMQPLTAKADAAEAKAARLEAMLAALKGSKAVIEQELRAELDQAARQHASEREQLESAVRVRVEEEKDALRAQLKEMESAQKELTATIDTEMQEKQAQIASLTAENADLAAQVLQSKLETEKVQVELTTEAEAELAEKEEQVQALIHDAREKELQVQMQQMQLEKAQQQAQQAQLMGELQGHVKDLRAQVQAKDKQQQEQREQHEAQVRELRREHEQQIFAARAEAAKATTAAAPAAVESEARAQALARSHKQAQMAAADEYEARLAAQAAELEQVRAELERSYAAARLRGMGNDLGNGVPPALSPASPMSVSSNPAVPRAQQQQAKSPQERGQQQQIEQVEPKQQEEFSALMAQLANIEASKSVLWEELEGERRGREAAEAQADLDVAQAAAAAERMAQRIELLEGQVATLEAAAVGNGDAAATKVARTATQGGDTARRNLQQQPPSQHRARSRAVPQAWKACPSGHELRKFVTPDAVYYCDECRSLVAEGEALFGCRACDFDVCAECYSAPRHAAEAARVSACRVQERAGAAAATAARAAGVVARNPFASTADLAAAFAAGNATTAAARAAAVASALAAAAIAAAAIAAANSTTEQEQVPSSPSLGPSSSNPPLGQLPWQASCYEPERQERIQRVFQAMLAQAQVEVQLRADGGGESGGGEEVDRQTLWQEAARFEAIALKKSTTKVEYAAKIEKKVKRMRKKSAAVGSAVGGVANSAAGVPVGYSPSKVQYVQYPIESE